jgi:hypothetical protein
MSCYDTEAVVGPFNPHALCMHAAGFGVAVFCGTGLGNILTIAGVGGLHVQREGISGESG